MNKKRILIAEKESIFVKELKSILEEWGHQVVAVCDKYTEVSKKIKYLPVDLIILNIDMQDTQAGIELLQEINYTNVAPVILVADSMKKDLFEKIKPFAPKGYYVKPIHLENLYTTLEFTFYNLDKEKEMKMVEKNYFVAKDGTTFIRIPFHKIKWIKSDKHYMEIYSDEKKRVLRMTMCEIEKMLPVNLFCRIHKSFIINIDAVKELRTGFVCIDDMCLPVGRKYKSNLYSRLEFV